MTIASTTTKQLMNGDGVTRVWPFTFRAWEDEVRVIVADAAGIETDVTAASIVTLDPSGDGGTVDYLVPAGHKIVVMRNRDLVQETRQVNVTRFDPAVIENQLDRLIANDQQQQEQIDRALSVGVTSGRDPGAVIEEVFQARDRAEAAATGAAGSESAAAASATEATGSAAAAAQALADTQTAGVTAQAAIDAAVTAGLSDVNASTALARKWAENPHGSPVEPGAFSAKHWAEEAADAVSGGTPIASPVQKGLVPPGGAAGQVYRTNATGTAYGWENFPEVTFATAAETVTGTATNKATTPAGVKAAIAAAVGAIPAPAGVPSGSIVMWSGAEADIPTDWALCDGTNGTPNLRGRFVMGADSINTPGSAGGSNKTGGTTLTASQMPSHGHGYTAPGYSAQYGGGTTGGGYNGAAGSTTGAAGGSQPHNHDLMPPYYALHFIMKL